eukprot:CAMPEP_0173149012 /NCGR_PEP_ID=MMETSP1105-20130129/10071_1 /TAXON_ID=2985 /ORGANISM="Ochromonas sp., Strain BG-1" /LENGTH=456 /DNA_ID=CAMNT_0014063795 /DNA_START=126 /DNA_END=1496 /DNA_ORIENTATION=-
MLSQNSPVAPLPPTNVNRNSTPSKLIRIGTGTSPAAVTTNVSPLVVAGRPSSNPRSNSNSKNIRVIQKLSQENLQPPNTNPLRSASRSASRRKQRRWENSHLFGVQEVLSAETFQQIIGATAEENFAEGRHYTRYLFPVDDKKSAFADLFVNRELLNIFRRCEEEISTPSSSVRKHKNQSVEEQCWMNMEKKLRTVFLSLLPTRSKEDESHRDDLKTIQPFVFLLRMEKLLFAFVDEALPKGSTVKTAQSTSSKNDSAQSRQLVSFAVDNERGHLRVDLIESSFYRMLFHGICQFYGLKSQSFVVKNSKNKYIIVNKPKKQLLAFDQSISITKYLYWKILSEEISSEDDVAVDSLAPSIENLTISNVSHQSVAPSTLTSSHTPAVGDHVSEASTPTRENGSLSTVSLTGYDSRSPVPNDLLENTPNPPSEEGDEQGDDYIVVDMDELVLEDSNSKI